MKQALTPLRPYQRTAYRYLCTGKGCVFVEMRLGKTKVVARYLHHRTAGPVLVVAPPSAHGAWEDEVAELCTVDKRLSITNLSGLPREKKLKELALALAFNGWILINPEAHRSIGDELASVRWSAVVLDESTFIKNPKAKVTKYYLKRFKRVPVRIVMTGTPNPETDLDVFTQVAFADGSFMGMDSFWHWRAAYCRPMGFEFQLTQKFRKLYNSALSERAFILNRKDVGMDREKVKEVRRLTMPSKVAKVYKTLERDLVLEVGGVERKSMLFTIERYTALRHLASGVYPDDKALAWNGKAEEIVALLRGELARQQVVVWWSLNTCMEMAAEYIRSQGIPCLTVSGELKAHEREARRKRFMSGKYQIIMAQCQVWAMGTDLSCASTAIYAQEPVSAFIAQQTQDRILNVSQRGPLLYIYLVTRNTVDEDIRAGMAAKRFRSRLTLGEVKHGDSQWLLERIQRRNGVCQGKR